MQDKSALAQRLTELPGDKRELLRKLLENKPAGVKIIPKRGERERVPLTFAQQRLWIVEQFLEGRTAYNQTNFIRFQSGIHVDAFRRAINEIVRRHETLRTTFYTLDGEPFQQVKPSLTIDIPVVDLSHFEPARREAEALRLVERDFMVPFDLEAGPLIRGVMYRFDASEHLFALTMHHIVCDGWSMGVFALELSMLYWNYAAGHKLLLPELPIQYGDFAVWQRNALSDEHLNPHLEYWRTQLQGIRNFDLPADHPRPAQFTYQGSRVPVVIGGELFRSLLSVAERQNTTMHVLLLTALFVLFHRYTGEEDIAIGAPVAGRTRKELEPLIGFFVNTQVMRADVSGDPTFLELLARVRQVCLGAQAHQDVPFERLIEDLRTVRDPSRNPLVQVVFQIFQPPSAAGIQRDFVFPFTPAPSGGSKFDLVFELIWHSDEIRGFAEYSIDLFEEARVARLISHFERLLGSIAADTGRAISALDILPAEELERVVHTWNATSSDYARDSNLVAEFQAQADRNPTRTAVEFGSSSLSYTELDSRATALAAQLIAHGVKRGDCVGLLMERCLDLPVAMLGILSTGAFYVPLDPRYPTERLAYLIADSGAKIVVTTSALETILAGIQVTCILTGGALEHRALELPAIAPTDTAWLLYTSGTTGKPKGVPVTHRGALRLVRGIDTPVTAADTVLQFAPIAFDASVFEIWMALLNGAKLAIHPPDTASLDDLGAFIREQNITWMFLTTSLVRQMIESNARDFRGVRQLVTGGEEMHPAVARAAWRELPRTRITNAYGPTECATIATTHTLTGSESVQDTVPIGKPIANTTVYLIDPNGNPVPIGIPGEIYIGGDGVAPGYWNRPDLTERSFVPDRWGPDPTAKLYRTGDMGRYRADGNIEFLGRRDRQVKIGGYRIEPGEVEAAIASHPDISGAAALVLEQDGEPLLAAFAENMPGRQAAVADLRNYLTGVLPRHMIPSRLRTLDRLPLTASGKVDLAELSRQAVSGDAGGPDYVEPCNALEKLLADLWKEVLHMDRIGVTDDFFALGGQSLVATRLLSRVRDTFQASATMREFFDTPTIRGIAALLSKDDRVMKRAELLVKLDSFGATFHEAVPSSSTAVPK